MLEVEGLRKRFGDTVALDDVAFSVPPGAMFGFVAANGAGKTTAMRIIMAVTAADGGAVRWRGTFTPPSTPEPCSLTCCRWSPVLGHRDAGAHRRRDRARVAAGYRSG